MSIHSSLRAKGSAMSSMRNVLKRHERVRDLVTKGSWGEGQSAFGLPKLKQMKIKTRKTAAKEKTEAAEGEQAAAPATGSSPSG